MAKVGFWLHGARGKLAGSSLRKGADGKTIISEIVTPYNPRTNAQIYQRAIMATVIRAYSAGKSVFDHSFQGRQVGAQNMERFMSLNARILRNLCVQEQSEMPWIHWGGSVIYPHCKARVVAYKSYGPVGFDGMQISWGSYEQEFFSVTEAEEVPLGSSSPLTFGIPASLVNETCAQYANRCGLIADDLYSICGFYPTDNWLRDGYDDMVSSAGLQRVYSFFVIRMHVKRSFVESSAVVSNKTLDDLFSFDEPVGQGVINEILKHKAIGSSFTMADFYTDYMVDDSTQAWCNIIRSRVNEDLRSKTQLKQNIAWADDGIIPAYVLPAWYPYITGSPYPNPPVVPEPAAPQLIAAFVELASGVYDYVLAAKLDDGSVHPYEYMGAGIPLSFTEGDIPVLTLTPMFCESFMVDSVQLKDLSNSIHCNIRPYQCSLDGSNTTFKAYIDGGIYTFVSNFVQGQNTGRVDIPLSEFHV